MESLPLPGEFELDGGIDYRLRELEYALAQSGVSVLIAARRFRNTDYVAMLTELAPELAAARFSRARFERLPSLRAVVYLSPDGSVGEITRSSMGWAYGSPSVYALAGNGASVATPNYPYAHTSALFDVVGGNNGACGGSYLCTALSGYDGPTGLGTPNGAATLR